MRPPLILLAEDSQDAREVIVEFLAEAGFHVLEAETGPDALELARNELPDLILMDLTLPGLSGGEAIQALRADQRTRSIPVAVLTGHSRGDALDLAQQAGCDAVLIKPFELDQLMASVRTLLEKGARQRAEPA